MLQIGDLHYDELLKATTKPDAKDAFAPSGLVPSHVRPIAPEAAKKLAQAINSKTNPVIAICGDLTSRGDLTVFEAALKYLAGILNLNEHPSLEASSVHLVPGNHDVDWKDSMPYVDLGPGRFNSLVARVDTSGLGIPITTTLRHSSISTAGGSKVEFLSLNSCRGAGAPREFPAVNDAILDQLKEIALERGVDLSVALVDAAKSVDCPHELLDIPLVHPDDLVRLTEVVSCLARSRLPIILAHHGFLPQGVPRFNPYTEMVNGGAVREMLLYLSRPIMYLHGHIHRGTSEVLQGGPDGSRGGPVVVISAPPLSEGFNEICIEFDNSHEPLGLTIRRHRLNQSTGMYLETGAPERIPLSRPAVMDAKMKPIFAYLNEHGLCRGSNLLTVGMNAIEPAELEDLVMRAVWQGVVRVTPDSYDKLFAEREFLFR